MTPWRQRALALPLLAFAATALMLANQSSAQTTRSLAKVGGVWDTTWGGGRAVLELVQAGAAVTGSYSGTNQGKVKGTLSGDVLTGNWRGAANDGGGFMLRFSADGMSFTGTWGIGSSRTDGGAWVGARK
jgi:hypothetical protein